MGVLSYQLQIRMRMNLYSISYTKANLKYTVISQLKTDARQIQEDA